MRTQGALPPLMPTTMASEQSQPSGKETFGRSATSASDANPLTEEAGLSYASLHSHPVDGQLSNQGLASLAGPSRSRLPRGSNHNDNHNDNRNDNEDLLLPSETASAYSISPDLRHQSHYFATETTTTTTTATADRPARVCLLTRRRVPSSGPSKSPDPSPPRVGVASSSCPSPLAGVERRAWTSAPPDGTNGTTLATSYVPLLGLGGVAAVGVAVGVGPVQVKEETASPEWSEDSEGLSDEDTLEDGLRHEGSASVIADYGGQGTSGNASGGGAGIGQSDQPDTKDGMDELCPVCGDKVSGYHYGLLTCESCKGFFKRTVQNKKVYTCVADRSCIIDKTQRKRCPYCRFQKCLDVGMKLEAVRHDRMRGGRNKFGPMYKRDRARKLQVMRQRQAIVVHHNVLSNSITGANNSITSGSQSLSAYASSSVYTPPTLHIKQEIQIPQVTSMTSSPGSSPGPLTQQTGLASMAGSSGLDHNQVLAQHTDPTTGGVQWQISTGSKEFQFQSGMGGNVLSGSNVMSVSGGKMPAILREFLSSLDDKEWQSELYKLLQSQSFNQVEVDLFELLCKVLDHNLFAQVDWARNSYYFKELKVDDQMTLLQNSWSEMLILDQIHQRMHNHLPDETTLHNGQKFELLSLALLGVPSMSDTFQELTSKLAALKFDSADFVCLKFVLLLNPEVRNLNNRKHVQECYDQVRRVLLEYCINCYPNVPDKFNQLLSLLPDLREMAQRGEDFLYFKHMQGNAPTQTLLMEMLHAKKR